MTTLEGHNALVTGASAGIGRALAVALAAQRATVILVGRHDDPLHEVRDCITRQDGTARVVSANLEREDNIRQIQARLDADGVEVDLLVHSAGAHIPGRWIDGDVNTLDQQYLINVRAPYLLTRLLLPSLLRRQGQVVFVNSSAGTATAPAGIGQYAATKHALKALADSLRAEVNAEGVRVLSVYPGRTATRMQEALFQSEGREYQPERLLQPEDIAAAVVNALLLPRTAEVTDLFIRPFHKV